MKRNSMFNVRFKSDVFLIVILSFVAFLAMDLIAAEKTEAKYEYSLNARQMFYLDGVPHTDRDGRIRIKYHPERSFLPIILYHPRTHLDAEKTMPTPFDKIREAGFNTVETTEAVTDELLTVLNKNDLKLIKVNAKAQDAQKFADNPAMFAWEIFDEPEMDGRFDVYQDRLDVFAKTKKEIGRFDPVRPVYVNTTQWIGHPNMNWWVKWHQAGDISCHDNYPYNTKFNGWTKDNRPTSLSFHFGIPETMGLALSCTEEKKPVWIIVQAFEGRTWFFPTGPELRAMVYAGIVHGAVGINYFTYDSYVCRINLLGISPDPAVSYGKGREANEYERAQMKYLWECVAAMNSEIEELAPWILSPTSKEFYKVNIRGDMITNAPIRTLLKKYNDEYRLFAVNIDRAKIDIKIDFSDKISDVESLFVPKDKEVNFKDKSFSDSLEPMDVKVYKIKLSSLN